MSNNLYPAKTYWQNYQPNGKHRPGPTIRVTVQANHPQDATRMLESQYGKDKLQGPAILEY